MIDEKKWKKKTLNYLYGKDDSIIANIGADLIAFVLLIIIKIFHHFSWNINVPLSIFMGILLFQIVVNFILVIYKDRIRDELLEDEVGNNSIFNQKTENLEEYDNLRTHYALHNIKNSTKNMDWALQSIDKQNVTESELDELKANLKRINETLDDFNKLNNIREQKQFEIQELKDIFDKLVRPSVKTKGIKFTFFYENEVPQRLIIHQTFYDVFQIFNNLIINAQKAMESSERKEMQIVVNQVNEKEVWFEVRDTGVGIPAENRNKIFDIHFSTTGGTGIGLAYVRNELKKMGGQIALVVSNEQFSTIFGVKIPIN